MALLEPLERRDKVDDGRVEGRVPDGTSLDDGLRVGEIHEVTSFW